MSKFRQVGRIAAAAVAALVGLYFVAGGWWASNVLRDELLTPRQDEVVRDVEILGVGSGRVVLSMSELAAADGVFGLDGANGYGQVSTVASSSDERVERSLRVLDGEFLAGDLVAIDQYAFFGDPLEAHGIAFEEVLVPGADGALPAWLVPGQRDTWIVFIHGKGLDERKQVLRLLPSLVEADFPVLAITYRNDLGSPESPTGSYHWGLDEWRDVDAAMRFAEARGARQFVLVGYGMGASIASITLHESDFTSKVRGAIFDSPILSLDSAADTAAERRGLPDSLRSIAKGLLGLRHQLDWDQLDQVERAAEFDVPLLVLHGTNDAIAPAMDAEAIAELQPDLVTLRMFEAGHLLPWNSDPARYEEAVSRFLAAVTAP